MKVLVINTHDIIGGAAKATYRIHTELRNLGVESQMFVLYKSSNDSSVREIPNKFLRNLSKINRYIDRLPLLSYRGLQSVPFSSGLVWSYLNGFVKDFKADVIHLNWISSGFVPIRLLGKLHYPVLWTLHDSWAFTGGCHLHFSCSRYYESCGQCPHLQSDKQDDLSFLVWKQKYKYYENMNLGIVTPSRWMFECATKSSLLKKKTINIVPHGVDLKVFRPVEKKLARNKFGFPQNRRIILFGAAEITSSSKGLEILQNATLMLRDLGWKDNTKLVVFGNSTKKAFPDMGLDVQYVGYIFNENRLAELYSAADIFVSPSITESFGLTILEALACGTPQVAFRIGGIPDIIDHKETGYLARPYSVDDLVNGIMWVLEDNARRKMLSHNSRNRAESKFSITDTARRYIELYNVRTKTNV
jgi:glycosyltransferase involved in cell wall biosynthesis